MTKIEVAILDAAERRMQVGGFNGFSFRDIASDVGVKSSSVHYHFRTKDDLAAAVVRRYTGALAERMDQRFLLNPDPIRIWTDAFKNTLHSPDHLCPCMVLGAVALNLPPQVAAEVTRFFTMCLEKLVAEGLARDEAAGFLSTLTGAAILSVATGDFETYDRATNVPERGHARHRPASPAIPDAARDSPAVSAIHLARTGELDYLPKGSLEPFNE